jgi:hypothetical protein
MKSKNQIILFSIFLIAASVALVSYKIYYLNFPLFQDETSNIWNIEAKIRFDSQKEKSALVSMALPPSQNGFITINEESSSPNYGYTNSVIDNVKKGVWSKRQPQSGEQTLYYSIDIIKDRYFKTEPTQFEQTIQTEEAAHPISQAASSIIENIYQKSANSITFASLLIKEFNRKEPSQAVQMIKNNYMKDDREKRDALVYLIKKKGFQVYSIGALYLQDKQRNIPLDPMLEVFYKDKWYLFDINEGSISNSSDIFIWQRGSQFLLDAEGVDNSRVSFSVTKSIVPARTAALSNNVKNQSVLLDFSLFTLPNETQNTFKLLLLVPLGALVVVFMRLLVGIKTSGTFMPVLLAMAFIETELLPGILMFLLVVAMGLFVRSYLSHLNLLLVARISSVLIVVVGIMSFVAILSQKLDLEYATSITFFPIIILSWTVERMSILWEEEGSKEVLQQGGGSLIVAVLAYFIMTDSTLSFITFNFPETLLGVLGVIILVGRYSGYRLSELYRFRTMVK